MKKSDGNGSDFDSNLNVFFIAGTRKDDGKVQVAICPNKYNPQAWGIILCDFARHIANSFDDRISREEVVEDMKEFFNREWDNPTSDIEVIE